MLIEDRDISVVVQGAIIHSRDGAEQGWTEEVCRSVRRHLPKAELILSTWKGSIVDQIDYDLLVENEDPGGFLSYYNGYDKDPSMNNMNRQIVSTREGIKRASRKYVMKLRSDSLLLNTDFLNWYEMYGEEGERIATFEPRNPYGIFKSQYSLCDFWFFGTRDKMKSLWDIPFYESSPLIERDLLCEEYLMYQVMLHKGGMKGNEFRQLENNLDRKSKIDKAYRNLMKNEFIIIPTRKSGIICKKYPKLNSFSIVCIRHYVVSFSDWCVWTYEWKTRYLLCAFGQSVAGKMIAFLRRMWK